MTGIGSVVTTKRDTVATNKKASSIQCTILIYCVVPKSGGDRAADTLCQDCPSPTSPGVVRHNVKNMM